MGAPPREPRWSEQDRLIVEAWFEYLDGLCPDCGQPRDIAWAMENEWAWVGEVVHCWVCATQEKARERHLSQENPERHGVKAIARRRE